MKNTEMKKSNKFRKTMAFISSVFIFVFVFTFTFKLLHNYIDLILVTINRTLVTILTILKSFITFLQAEINYILPIFYVALIVALCVYYTIIPDEKQGEKTTLVNKKANKAHG